MSQASKLASKFGSVAGLKISYLRNLKYEDFHRKRLLAHIRSNILNSNEYLMYTPSKRTGRRLIRERLKGPILQHFYEDNDDRVKYGMTKNNKSQYEAITDY